MHFAYCIPYIIQGQYQIVLVMLRYKQTISNLILGLKINYTRLYHLCFTIAHQISKQQNRHNPTLYI